MPTFTALLKNKELQVQYTDSDNVMIALYDEVDWGTCGGSGVCGTCVCHIVDGEEFFAEPDINEEDTLEFMNVPNARLGCQLWLDAVPDKKLTIRVKDVNN